MSLEQALVDYEVAGLVGIDDPECFCAKCGAIRKLRVELSLLRLRLLLAEDDE